MKRRDHDARSHDVFLRGVLSAGMMVLTQDCSLLVPTVGELSGGSPDAGPADVMDATSSDAGLLRDAAFVTDAGILSDTTPPRDAAPLPGLVASWPFDEGNGSTAHDATGQGHDGAITGGATWIAGHSGSALLLDGVSGVVSAPCRTGFDRPGGASFSMTAWILRPSAGTQFSNSSIVAVAFQSMNGSFVMEATSDNQMSYWSGLGGAQQIALSTVDYGTMAWHHMAIVVDAAPSARAYFDGVRLGTGVPDTTARTCTLVYIGGSNYLDRLPAALDNIRYYGRALSDSEVVADMNE